MFHLQNGCTVGESAKAAIEAIMFIWEKTGIPAQRVDSGVRKLRKLYIQYCLLKKTRLTPKNSCRMKEQLFISHLYELFDISSKDALKTMKNENYRQFLLLQRQDSQSSSMSGIDGSLSKKESRKRLQDDKAAASKERCAAQVCMDVPSSSAVADTDSASSAQSDQGSDDNFKMPSTPEPPQRKRLHQNILTAEVAASLDRVMLPDCGAMFVVGAVAQALGHDLSDVVLSRNSIQRARTATHEASARAEQAAFSPDMPLLLHWDGKLLPVIAGKKEPVDRVAVLVTGGEVEQLLGVPKIGRGTGVEQWQCRASLTALDDWQLKSRVEGLVFDTTQG